MWPRISRAHNYMAPLNARSGHTYSLTSSEVSSIRAHVKHDAYMHNGQRRGKQKHNLSQKIEKNRGMCRFCENREKFIVFLEIHREMYMQYASLTHDLGDGRPWASLCWSKIGNHGETNTQIDLKQTCMHAFRVRIELHNYTLKVDLASPVCMYTAYLKVRIL